MTGHTHRVQLEGPSAVEYVRVAPLLKDLPCADPSCPLEEAVRLLKEVATIDWAFPRKDAGMTLIGIGDFLASLSKSSAAGRGGDDLDGEDALHRPSGKPGPVGTSAGQSAPKAAEDPEGP